ncbi:MAG: hydroxyisourate hydrolase [Myxococcaceae bacterium]|nr:hydroxyisourate hydrolase [Myxococcaceae bacterium]
MSTLSTHVLDVSLGRPAANLPILLEAQIGATGWKELARGVTNADGRIKDFLPSGTSLSAGVYRLTFDTAAYFASKKTRGFYPYVQVVFEIAEAGEHYHVPLLLSPFGFSTYRGS